MIGLKSRHFYQQPETARLDAAELLYKTIIAAWDQCPQEFVVRDFYSGLPQVHDRDVIDKFEAWVAGQLEKLGFRTVSQEMCPSLSVNPSLFLTMD